MTVFFFPNVCSFIYLSQGEEVVLSTAQTQVEEEEGEDNYNEGYCYK